MVRGEEIAGEDHVVTAERIDDEYREQMNTVDEYFNKHHPDQMPHYVEVRNFAHRIMYGTRDVEDLKNRNYVDGPQFLGRVPNLTSEERAALETLIEHKIKTAEAANEGASESGAIETVEVSEGSKEVVEAVLSAEAAFEAFDHEGFAADIAALQPVEGESYRETADRLLGVLKKYASVIAREKGPMLALPVPGRRDDVKSSPIKSFERAFDTLVSDRERGNFRDATNAMYLSPLVNPETGEDPLADKLRQLFPQR